MAPAFHPWWDWGTSSRGLLSWPAPVDTKPHDLTGGFPWTLGPRDKVGRKGLGLAFRAVWLGDIHSLGVAELMDWTLAALCPAGCLWWSSEQKPSEAAVVQGRPRGADHCSGLRPTTYLRGRPQSRCLNLRPAVTSIKLCWASRLHLVSRPASLLSQAIKQHATTDLKVTNGHPVAVHQGA